MSEQTFDPSTQAPNKERPFLPRINDGGVLGQLGEGGCYPAPSIGGTTPGCCISLYVKVWLVIRNLPDFLIRSKEGDTSA